MAPTTTLTFVLLCLLEEADRFYEIVEIVSKTAVLIQSAVRRSELGVKGRCPH